MTSRARRHRSEPHVVLPPVSRMQLQDERGVIHLGWQNVDGAMRMGCGYYSLEWTNAKRMAVTCLWCTVGYLPWLHWGPGAPEKLQR